MKPSQGKRRSFQVCICKSGEQNLGKTPFLNSELLSLLLVRGMNPVCRFPLRAVWSLAKFFFLHVSQFPNPYTGCNNRMVMKIRITLE